MNTLTLTNTRRINADVIPNDATHIVYVTTKNADGTETTTVDFKKSARSAKIGYGKAGRAADVNVVEYGWKLVYGADRDHGMFAW